MSKYQGGMIGSVANATSGTAYTGRANGVFPLPQQIVAKSSSLWAIGQTRPNPPTIGTATGTGATTISVAFIPPVQYGGSPITSYTVTSSGGQTATGSSSPIVVTGLTTGTSYTFTVTATNALGTSVSSGTSNSAQPAITDPYFSSVSLLLNGDGTNGSTVFTDLSSSPKTVTNNGSVTVNTSVKKLGTGAIYVPASGSYLTAANTGSSLDLETGDFTIEFWLYVTAFVNYVQHVSTRTSNSTTMWGIDSRADGTIYMHSNDFVVTSLPGKTANLWNHVCVVRQSGICKMYINGVLEGTSTNTSLSSANFAAPSGVGIGAGPAGMQGGTAYIDDLRITKGIARYTTNFTPPTAAFPTL